MAKITKGTLVSGLALLMSIGGSILSSNMADKRMEQTVQREVKKQLSALPKGNE